MEPHIERQMLGDTDQEREMRRDLYQRNPDHEVRFRDHLWRQYGGTWQFNEIIGFVRLYVDGGQILGEHWRTDAKRIVRTRKKQFVWNTHKIAPERDLPHGGSNEQIYAAIQEYLTDVRAELKNRVLDTSVFDKVGPYIDWGRLLEDG